MLENVWRPNELGEWAVRLLFEQASVTFYSFILVLFRLSGLVVIGPLLASALLPVNVRVLMVFAMALVITPAVAANSAAEFARLDANRDGRVVAEEVPGHFRARFERGLERFRVPPDRGLTPEQWPGGVLLPSSPLELAAAVASEFSIGFALGLGVMTILSGLQLAGELLDQQAGISLGQVFNPGFDDSGSPTGTLFFMMATTILLVMEPLNGHLQFVSALMETFRTLPLGEAVIGVPTVELIRDLVHQSMVLALLVAAPLLAVMSLVAITMGYLGHSVPQINVLVIGFPIRVTIHLLILGITLSGMAEAVVDVVPRVLDRMLEIEATAEL